MVIEKKRWCENYENWKNKCVVHNIYASQIAHVVEHKFK